MTLAHGTDRLESDRLVLRRVTSDDLPFFTRLHAPPDVAQLLYPGGQPRSPEEMAAWLTFETELGDTFDPAVWGQGFATEAACCVRDCACDVLGWPYVVSAILPQKRALAARRRTGRRARRRPNARGWSHVGSLGVASS